LQHFNGLASHAGAKHSTTQQAKGVQRMSFANYATTTPGNYRRGAKKDNAMTEALKARQQARRAIEAREELKMIEKEYEL
jgi:hypothetical protein